MAKLRKKVLGTVSGAVGDILFRTRNGKNYLGTKPLSFMPGMDERSVLRRQRFAMATRLAKPVNSLDALKSLWKTVTPSNLSPYNQIVKTNYRYVLPDSVSDQIKLVPDIGFSVSVANMSFDQTRLRVSLTGITSASGIDPAIENYFQMVGILFLSKPVDEGMTENIFLRVIFDEQTLRLNNDLDFNLAFNDQVTQLISMYRDRKAFLTLLTLNSERCPVNYSNTFFSS